MADPDTVATGGPVTAEGGTGAPAEGKVDTAPEPFVGTYASKEAAEAGIAEKDKTIGELKSTVAQLKSSQEQLQADAIAKLASIQEAQSKGAKESQGPDRAAVLAGIKERMQKAVDDGDSAAYADLMGELAEGEQAYIESRLAERDQELKSTLGQINSTLENLAQRTNPRYQTHREKVDQLMATAKESGIDLDFNTAVWMAETSSAVEQPARPDLPGSTAGGDRVSGGEPRKVMSDSEKETWKAVFGAGGDIPASVLEKAIANEEAARKEDANA